MANNAKLFLKLIAQNPFRVLGVYTNAPQKDVLANANKIKAFSKVGKDLEFPSDNLPDYPEVIRDVDTVNVALKSLDFDAERFNASLFWFSNSTPFDNIALKHLASGNVDKAISIWSKKDDLSSLLNISIAAAIKRDWPMFAKSAYTLFEKYSQQICETFGAVKSMTSEDLILSFLNTINSDNPRVINEIYACSLKVESLDAVKSDDGDIEIYEVYVNGESRRMKFTIDGETKVINFSTAMKDFSDDYILNRRDEFVIVYDCSLEPKPSEQPISQTWVQAVYKILEERLIAKVDSLITEIHAIDKKDFMARRKGALRLLDIFRGSHFNRVLNTGLDRAIRGKIVKEAIDCVIDYYNNADDQDAIVEDACSIAHQVRVQARHTMHVKRVQENYLKLKGHVSKLPPKEIRYYQHLLEARIDKYNNEPSTIGNALRFIKDCAPYLMSIKGIIGETHSYYIEVSTRVAAAVVSDVIEDFNKQSDDILPRVKNVSSWEKRKLLDQFKALVTTAATAMYQLTFFGMDADFKNQRFQKNYDILKNQAIDCGAITPVDSKYSVVIEVNGKFKSCSKFEDFLPEVDTRNEDEYFATCKSVADCQNYQRIFPEGKYTSQIDAKLEECTFNDCTTNVALDAFCAQYPNTKLNVAAKRDEISFKLCKSVNDYQIYLKKYPTGRFVVKAKQRIDDLRFVDCTGRLDFIKYLKDFPNGKHSLEAQRTIDDIDFKDCKTISDFEKYLTDHPHGCHVVEANTQVDNLTFAACSSEESYFNYLKKFPSGLHASETREKLADYKLWKECEQKKSRKLYQEYVARFPKGIYRAEADKRLKSWWRSLLAKVTNDKSSLIVITIVVAVLIGIGLIWGVDGYKGLMCIIGGLAAMATVSTFFALFQKEWKPFVICLGLTVVFLGGGLGWDYLERELEHQELIKQRYLEAINDGSIMRLSDFLYDYSDSKYAPEVRSLLYDKCIVSGFDRILWFTGKYHDTAEGEKAYNIVTSKCDSIFNALGITGYNQTIAYKEALDSLKVGATNPLQTYMADIVWQDEESAWNMASKNNKSEYYQKFIDMYPNSQYASRAEKRLIDLEVNNVLSGSYDELPSLNQSGYGYGSTSTISVYNNTSYALTVMYSGSDSKRLIIPPHQREYVTLPNGKYKCVASISGNARNHAGEENLTGGSYEVEYYIVTSTYPTY